MARRISLEPHLTIEELERSYRSTKDPVERSRWHFLWLLARGLTAKVIASIAGYSAYWIGRIARRYSQHGPAGVKDLRRQSRPSIPLLLRQRLLQIACGYEDQNDADTLRHDPLLKFVCGRHPHKPSSDLASQPTFSRLENAIDRRACYRLAHAQNTLSRQNCLGFAIVATHWRHRWLVGFG